MSSWNREKFMNELENADMVLVGVGEEFDDFLNRDTNADEMRTHMRQNGVGSFFPAWQYFVQESAVSEEAGNLVSLRQCLMKLCKLLESKNYFVVSTSTNPVIFDIPWKKDRIVMPCGSNRLKQCSAGCSRHLTALSEAENKKIDLKSTNPLGKCSECGHPIELNNIYAENYDENGYLDTWKIYTKWLQGSVNRRLLLLELGVGMKFPSVIRFPFEKVAYFNQKASMYRVHKSLYFMTEELADKGVGIAENAIDWLQNL